MKSNAIQNTKVKTYTNTKNYKTERAKKSQTTSLMTLFDMTVDTIDRTDSLIRNDTK